MSHKSTGLTQDGPREVYCNLANLLRSSEEILCRCHIVVSDDKKQIKAHRYILSACSSVFKEILQINTYIQ